MPALHSACQRQSDRRSFDATRCHNGTPLCRNIRTLYNFQPAATDAEIRAAALPFERKLSGCTAPSHANAAALDRGVEAVTAAATRLLNVLETNAPQTDRDVEAEKARARSKARFG